MNEKQVTVDDLTKCLREWSHAGYGAMPLFVQCCGEASKPLVRLPHIARDGAMIFGVPETPPGFLRRIARRFIT